jgi:hypothetical protein
MSEPKDFRNVKTYDKLLGKVRPTDNEGVDITEQVNHSMKTTACKSDEIIGKVMLVDKEGNDLGEAIKKIAEKLG